MNTVYITVWLCMYHNHISSPQFSWPLETWKKVQESGRGVGEENTEKILLVCWTSLAFLSPNLYCQTVNNITTFPINPTENYYVWNINFYTLYPVASIVICLVFNCVLTTNQPESFHLKHMFWMLKKLGLVDWLHEQLMLDKQGNVIGVTESVDKSVCVFYMAGGGIYCT